MKYAIFAMALCAVLTSGCSTNIVSMGGDTFFVEHRGSSWSTSSSLKLKCLKDANKFCNKRKLSMVVIQTSGHDGGFGVVGSCELIFKAVPTNSIENVSPVFSEEHLIK